ncbi:hypothetical protein BB559_003776 [Furculomyces boomerangus]|uniref:Telomere-associated protein Rif1 N-terminal domain-containing protein n=1 Tax=Furculomyces boomerangus TaxID=61424 RepID=A0A2T9YIY5_9FUNG|nr:hypothetical protein BB559_003776 [Furculomyces boomerangus]
MDPNSENEVIKRPELFDLDPIDSIDPWQEVLFSLHFYLFLFYEEILEILSLPEMEAHVQLQEMASSSMEGHGKLIDGLLYGILVNEHKSLNYYRSMMFVARDGFSHATSRIRLIASYMKFFLIKEGVKKQLFWLLNELIKVNTQGIHQIIVTLTKQMRGGDISRQNIRLCQFMLEIVKMNKDWVYQSPELIATLFYSFGRLILDHSKYPDLRDQECDLVISLFREKVSLFLECSVIGRDMIRVLQDIAMIPKLKLLWIDIINNPQRIDIQFQDIWQILKVPTPKNFLANRLTYDMESKLLFILENLKMINFQRNLSWFTQQFLSTPESDPLFSDIIRYICGVFHPTNQQLASDLVPRYVLIGALFRMIRSPVVAANVKLALIYDFIFYNINTDSIMNIEPYILLVERSLERYSYLSATLIEFLGYISESYCSSISVNMKKSISSAMSSALEKGVLTSLDPIYEFPRIPPSVKRQIQILFPGMVTLKKPITIDKKPLVQTSIHTISNKSIAPNVPEPSETDENTELDNSESIQNISESLYTPVSLYSNNIKDSYKDQNDPFTFNNDSDIESLNQLPLPVLDVNNEILDVANPDVEFEPSIRFASSSPKQPRKMELDSLDTKDISDHSNIYIRNDDSLETGDSKLEESASLFNNVAGQEEQFQHTILNANKDEISALPDQLFDSIESRDYLDQQDIGDNTAFNKDQEKTSSISPFDNKQKKKKLSDKKTSMKPKSKRKRSSTSSEDNTSDDIELAYNVNPGYIEDSELVTNRINLGTELSYVNKNMDKNSNIDIYTKDEQNEYTFNEQSFSKNDTSQLYSTKDTISYAEDNDNSEIYQDEGSEMASDGGSDEAYCSTKIEEMLNSPSLQIFGTLPFDLNSAVNNEDEKLALEKLEEIYKIFLESDIQPEIIGEFIGLVLRGINLEDVEMNNDFELSNNTDAVEHDLVYWVCVMTFNACISAESSLELETTKASSKTGHSSNIHLEKRCLLFLRHMANKFSTLGFRWFIFTVLTKNCSDLYRKYISVYRMSETNSRTYSSQNIYDRADKKLQGIDYFEDPEQTKKTLSSDLFSFRESFELMFYLSLPKIYSSFQKEIVGNVKLLETIANNILQPQLHRLLFWLIVGNFSIFGENPSQIVLQTIDWETGLQITVWQMLKAEISGSKEQIYNLLEFFASNSELDWSLHSEVANGFLAILGDSIPTAKMLGNIIRLSNIDQIYEQFCSKNKEKDRIETVGIRQENLDIDGISEHIVAAGIPYSLMIPISVFSIWARSSSFELQNSLQELIRSVKNSQNESKFLTTESIILFSNVYKKVNMNPLNMSPELELFINSNCGSKNFTLGTTTDSQNIDITTEKAKECDQKNFDKPFLKNNGELQQSVKPVHETSSDIKLEKNHIFTVEQLFDMPLVPKQTLVSNNTVKSELTPSKKLSSDQILEKNVLGSKPFQTDFKDSVSDKESEEQLDSKTGSESSHDSTEGTGSDEDYIDDNEIPLSAIVSQAALAKSNEKRISISSESKQGRNTRNSILSYGSGFSEKEIDTVRSLYGSSIYVKNDTEQDRDSDLLSTQYKKVTRSAFQKKQTEYKSKVEDKQNQEIDIILSGTRPVKSKISLDKSKTIPSITSAPMPKNYKTRSTPTSKKEDSGSDFDKNPNKKPKIERTKNKTEGNKKRQVESTKRKIKIVESDED